MFFRKYQKRQNRIYNQTKKYNVFNLKKMFSMQITNPQHSRQNKHVKTQLEASTRTSEVQREITFRPSRKSCPDKLSFLCKKSQKTLWEVNCMRMVGNQTLDDDHFVAYTDVKLQCFTLETSIMLYTNFASIRKKTHRKNSEIIQNK